MAKNEIVYIPVNELQNFMKDVFIKLGVPSNEAIQCSEVLIKSDLRGIESHGVGRLKMYYDRIRNGQHKPITNIEIIKESPTTALIDGNHGMGMIIGIKSMQMAIDKAKAYGMGSVAVRNSTHFGIDGYYPLMAVKENMIGLSVTNARPAISPTFGVKPMLGTNPIAFGAPTDEECPFLYDGATSITQRGKIEVKSREEKPTPEGWVIDQFGNSMTDSDEILNGLTQKISSLLPLGGAGELLAGHKGYGLATMVEILSASLQGGNFLYGLTGIGEDNTPVHFRLGHFFMAINIESFIDIDSFKKITGQILRDLRNSTKAPKCERIYTAGEKEFEMEEYVMQHGVPVNHNLQMEINEIRTELNLNEYNFPF